MKMKPMPLLLRASITVKNDTLGMAFPPSGHVWDGQYAGQMTQFPIVFFSVSISEQEDCKILSCLQLHPAQGEIELS